MCLKLHLSNKTFCRLQNATTACGIHADRLTTNFYPFQNDLALAVHLTLVLDGIVVGACLDLAKLLTG